MSPNALNFIAKIKEIFQFDQTDLDFGIYKILNVKKDEIKTYLETKLIPEVAKTLAENASDDGKALQAELFEMEKSLKNAGINPDDSPKVQEIKEKLKNSTSTEEMENEVFSHLSTFFSRYYSEGDFISKRRYKGDTYAIPYSGEEVKLHWANADQYYIKTSEYFANYSFFLDEAKTKKVSFVLIEADTEQNNNKSEKDRRFVIKEESFWAEENGELKIFFEYKALDEKKEQKKCNEETLEKMEILKGNQSWIGLFALFATEKNKTRTLLEKHLQSYTARNSFDYFIHKDLGGFLSRELDFYIKNEVMFLDDIEGETALKAESYLSKIRAIRKVAKKVILLLAQLENFQKKLWEKKKFVYNTNYLITLDHINEKHFEAIANNEKQIQQWKDLGFLDEKCDTDFLKTHPTLAIDTQFFAELKWEFLAEIENLDEQTTGVMINSENFGALNTVQEKYKEEVKCVYIDPPYNKGGDDFIYKDGFSDSSWITMVNDRLTISKNLFNKDSRFFASIDDIENENFLMILKNIFGKENYLGSITWEKRTKAQNTDTAKKMLQSKMEYIHPFRLSEKRQEFNLEESGEKEYLIKDEIGFYRLHEIGQMSSEGMRGRETMIFGIDGISPRDGMQWKIGKDEVEKMKIEKRLVIKDKKPYFIYRPEHEHTSKFSPFWSHFFDKDTYGTAESGLAEISNDLGFGRTIETVKPILLIKKILFHSSDTSSLILDYFAGSGTTGHAVLRLNREDNEKAVLAGLTPDGKRKFILVEMGQYFGTVTKPRIHKVIFSDDWKNGKPQDDGKTGSSKQIIKYFSLESYEDTLNNLQLSRSSAQQRSFDAHEKFYEDYLLGYMLDTESRESALNLKMFSSPFGHSLEIGTGTAGETEKITVDLPETLNYLLGLNVFSVQKFGDEFLKIEGVTRTGEKTLIIWRDTQKVDNQKLEEFFKKQRINPVDFEFEKIFVNGDNHLENLRTDEEHWKVVLIEEVFHKRMFVS